MMTGCQVFVTGASGFIGRHLCQRLREEGTKVCALVRREDSWLTQQGIKCCVGDLASPEAWIEALDGVDYVIHCAGNAMYGDGAHYYRENVEWTRGLVEAVKSKAPGIHRFVFISTIGAVDRTCSDSCSKPLTERSIPAPTSDYGRSKLKAEQLIRQSGLPYCIVRPTMVVGEDMRPGSHFAVFARHAIKPSVLGRLSLPGKFSVVHVDDLAEAVWLCARHPDANGMTLFCAGDPVELGTFFESCSQEIPRLPLRWVATAIQQLPWLVPFGVKALTLPALVASDENLRRLGWRPVYSGIQALDAVISRERKRLRPHESPDGQTVITGAASGLGRALVQKFSRMRPRLLLIDRNREALEAVAEQHPHARIVVEDLGSRRGVEAILSSKQWNQYPVSELFACAGIGARGPIVDLSVEKQLDIFHVNVLARLSLAYAAVQQMARRHFGRVVFISSSSAFQALPFMGVYAASNAAVLFLGEAWSEELKQTGVEMITVCPGGMNTNFQEAAGVRKVAGEPLLDPEVVADAILKSLASGKASLTISARARAMSLAARLLPRTLSLKLWRRLMERMR